MKIENGKFKKILFVYCFFLCVLLGCVGLFFSRIQWMINMNPDVYKLISEFEKEIEEIKIDCEELEKQIELLRSEN